MARLRGSMCRLCRAEGDKLFLKGPRCVTDKCAISRRQAPPGQHTKIRRKESDYGVQLREKQKVKRIYGMLEKQFRHFFRMAERAKGVTGLTLLELLERRLDNTIFRMRFASSRRMARQIVQHGSVYVNARRVDIPSFLVKTGDVVEIRDKDARLTSLKETHETLKDRAIPKWLDVDAAHCKAAIVAMPMKDDVGFPIREQLIVELYSK